MHTYQQPEKIKAREDALEYAIRTLTEDRFKSTVTKKSYVREVRDWVLHHGTEYDKAITKNLSDKEIAKWENFYQSVIGHKKTSNLKIAYLSGPNPLNDLRIIVDKGVLPENVWAFESDSSTYNSATIKALESEFPFIKIYEGRIEEYLKILPIKFDIVYLDFCGSITSKQTLSVVRELFYNQKLNSPGIIITNFAYQHKDDAEVEFWNNLTSLTANYLYPKPFTEKFTKMGGGYIESADSRGLTFDDFDSLAKKEPELFYSQFITRILYDLGSVLVPYQRFCENKFLTKLFFKNFKTGSIPDERAESILLFPNNHALLWGLNNFTKQNETFSKFLENFTRKLSLNHNNKGLQESIELLDFFLDEGIGKKFHSKKINKIEEGWDFTKKPLFCDAFLFHQLKDILISQLSSPYQYNVEKTKRWTYIAKTQRMFMDLITYDECRYIFDWMPSADMFEEGVSNINRQLVLRFAMDAISKNRRWYNDELFYGTAVIDQTKKGFEAKELNSRIKIN